MEDIKSNIERTISEDNAEALVNVWQIYEVVEGIKKQCTLSLYEDKTVISRGGHLHTLLYNKEVIGAKIKDEQI